MLLLGLETATDICGVALLDEDVLVVSAEVARPRAHAAHLVPLIRDVLAHAGATAADLGAVAVSAGPGSFTGLRIGVSTAKGLCAASGAALVGVPTLEALARAVLPAALPGDAVVAALPSRRGEVFAAAFDVEDGRLAPSGEVAALTHEDVAGWLPPNERLWLVGGAAESLAEVGRRPARLWPATASAVRVARLGAERFRAGHLEDVAAFEPAYLKAFVARPARPIFDGGGDKAGRP
ncbi:MAG TPA: tRNA (adenosine(37)-N6)-threonylcarbamoyltransferase complex dimerization subunit type 1 TsaB [Rubricoccaceae bacterium]|nr:tRNA (adenosine(37)-N6)-threonylcarbamoyltransferase complex dimerization subunit type 1 TsaB [Rubricoccaceae bacterium]